MAVPRKAVGPTPKRSKDAAGSARDVHDSAIVSAVCGDSAVSAMRTAQLKPPAAALPTRGAVIRRALRRARKRWPGRWDPQPASTPPAPLRYCRRDWRARKPQPVAAASAAAEASRAAKRRPVLPQAASAVRLGARGCSAPAAAADTGAREGPAGAPRCAAGLRLRHG